MSEENLVGQMLQGPTEFYKVIKLLGQGGFGAVYLAQHERLERTVAIKVILPEFAQQKDFIDRFEAEAKIVKQLEHPHIVPLYDYWQNADGAFLVMRHVSGGSLESKMGGPVPIDEVLRLFIQITSALELAHEREFIHRDIKPGNILIDEKGNAYLTDFGIAKSEYVKTAPERVVTGTLRYAPLEQLSGGEITPRTDVYSLGVVLYQMLSGESLPEVHQRVAEGLPSIDIVSQEINDVIQKAIAGDAKDRYPNMRIFREAFLEATRPKSAESSDKYDQILAELVAIRSQLQVSSESKPTSPDEMATVLGEVEEAKEPQDTVMIEGGGIPPSSSSRLYVILAVVLLMLAGAVVVFVLNQEEAPKEIIFESDRDGNFEIYIMDADGTNLRNLTNNPAEDRYATWSPDGKQIAFTSRRGGSYDIYIMDADGMNVRNLTNDPSSDKYPAWSPDGERVVFARRNEELDELYVIDIDGGNLQQITTGNSQGNPSSSHLYPEWSSDGKWIAYEYRLDGSGRSVYLVDMETMQRVELTSEEQLDGNPAWSPDSETIVFTARRGRGWEIYTMDVTGENMVAVTDLDGDNFSPTFSPDGKSIAFSGISQSTSWNIFVVDVESGEVTQLTDNEFHDNDPAWRP